MTLLVWVILGLVAGWVATRLMGSGGYGILGYIIFGVLGAVSGGWMGSILLGIDVTGLNFSSIALSVVGAVIVIAIFRAVAPGQSRLQFRRR